MHPCRGHAILHDSYTLLHVMLCILATGAMLYIWQRSMTKREYPSTHHESFEKHLGDSPQIQII